MDWNKPEMDRLRELWEAGHTGQEIADLFGNRSRSAVIAKARNLGFKQPPKPKRQRNKGERLSGMRKAYACRGDDMRARFVRLEPKDDEKRHMRHQRRQNRLPGIGTLAFVNEGRTKYPKRVLDPDKNILVSGYNNIKIGKEVRKGHLRGYRIFTLSLEERKTCPSSCQHWQICYGNNMPFAKRVDHTHPDFLKILEAAVRRECSVSGRTGVLIRLHALGDFYSEKYVQFWNRMLRIHENLAIYGYTARKLGEEYIGTMINEMNLLHPGRCMIRFSNGGWPNTSTVTIGTPEACPSNAFICPEQTGKTLGCDTCGACWGTRKNVAFLEH